MERKENKCYYTFTFLKKSPMFLRQRFRRVVSANDQVLHLRAVAGAGRHLWSANHSLSRADGLTNVTSGWCRACVSLPNTQREVAERLIWESSRLQWEAAAWRAVRTQLKLLITINNGGNIGFFPSSRLSHFSCLCDTSYIGASYLRVLRCNRHSVEER